MPGCAVYRAGPVYNLPCVIRQVVSEPKHKRLARRHHCPRGPIVGFNQMLKRLGSEAENIVDCAGDRIFKISIPGDREQVRMVAQDTMDKWTVEIFIEDIHLICT